MRQMIAGVAIGIVASTLFSVAFFGVLGRPVERELIDNWRKIQPEMSIAEVKRLLGSPSGEFPFGKPFPEFATRSVPKDFHLTHSLATYVIQGIGPQVLLIYYDDDDRVTYVSSAPT